LKKGYSILTLSPGAINFYKSLNEDIGTILMIQSIIQALFMFPQDLSSIEYRVQLNALKLTPPNGAEENLKSFEN
jgi:hypothetical protein